MDEEMQRRVRVGLNKGERVTALARVTFFGRQGRFQQREYEAQLNRATALSLLISAISVWNTRYYQEIAERVGGMADEVWAHISPISWEHVQFVGSYSFDESVSCIAERRHHAVN